MISTILNLIFLFCVTVIQNMAFTLVSRSRNSGNPAKHAKYSIFSNGIWFVINYFILFPEMMDVLKEGEWFLKLVFLGIYVSGTTLGSVWMMKMALGQTKGVPKIFHKFVKYFEEKDDFDKVGSRGPGPKKK